MGLFLLMCGLNTQQTAAVESLLSNGRIHVSSQQCYGVLLILLSF